MFNRVAGSLKRWGRLAGKDAVGGTEIVIGSDAQGDILYHNGSAYARLPAGTLGQALITQGAGANPIWGAGGKVTPYSFTDTSDVTIAAAVPSGTLWSSSQSIDIPTSGLLVYVPTFRVDNSTAGAHDYFIGLNINTTDYYPKLIENAVSTYQESFSNLNAGQVGDALGAINVASTAFCVLDIEALGISTGAQTVQPIISTDATGATQTLKGTTLTSRLKLIVVDFT